MKTDYQRFRVYGRNGCMGEFYSYGFDIESSRNIFALMKKEKVKILYQMPITKICNDGGSVVYENEFLSISEMDESFQKAHYEAAQKLIYGDEKSIKDVE